MNLKYLSRTKTKINDERWSNPHSNNYILFQQYNNLDEDSYSAQIDNGSAGTIHLWLNNGNAKLLLKVQCYSILHIHIVKHSKIKL